MQVLKTIPFLISAGLLEISGGYLIWIWRKNNDPVWYGISGMLLLAVYRFIPTLQSPGFGKVYAAYGGVFVVLSLLWGWKVDTLTPHKLDITGAISCLAGVIVIMFPGK